MSVALVGEEGPGAFPLRGSQSQNCGPASTSHPGRRHSCNKRQKHEKSNQSVGVSYGTNRLRRRMKYGIASDTGGRNKKKKIEMMLCRWRVIEKEADTCRVPPPPPFLFTVASVHNKSCCSSAKEEARRHYLCFIAALSLLGLWSSIPTRRRVSWWRTIWSYTRRRTKKTERN